MGGTISQEEHESWMAQQEHRTRTELERQVRQLAQELASERKRADGLQSMNSNLAAEVDRQRPVVEAAQRWARENPPIDGHRQLLLAVRAYEASRGAS